MPLAVEFVDLDRQAVVLQLQQAVPGPQAGDLFSVPVSCVVSHAVPDELKR